MTYDPAVIADYFDRFGAAEWDRFDGTLGDRVSLQLHTETLQRFLAPGMRVFEIGAGPGRFTEVIAGTGCSVVVADISARQLELNREHAKAVGFEVGIEAWHQLDVCDLAGIDTHSFDAVVAYGGPISYAMEKGEVALRECVRVLRPGGTLALSVMGLWGAIHRFFPGILDLPLDLNYEIIDTGDLNERTNVGTKHYCHLFRARELRDLLERNELEILHLAASSAISTGLDKTLAKTDEQWQALLDWERTACVEPGYLDAGTHLIAVARKPA